MCPFSNASPWLQPWVSDLPENDYAVFMELYKRKEPISIEELALILGLDQCIVSAICQKYSENITVNKIRHTEARLTEKGKSFTVLPDRLILQYLTKEVRAELEKISIDCMLDKKTVGECIRTLLERNWATKEGKTLEITEEGRKAAFDGTDPEVILFNELRSHG
jgi:hypothetical protein